MRDHAKKAVFPLFKPCHVFLVLLLLDYGGASPCHAAPQLRAPRNGDVYVVAHRGAHHGIPENTLAAYSKAIELGVDFVEIDVRRTKDGHLVSVHNATINDYACNGASGKISEMTLAELKNVDIGSRVDPKWKNERIPTLEEILSLCKGKVGIYLDLKDAPVNQVLHLIREYGMEGDVLWYADIDELKQVRELSPGAITMPDPGPPEGLLSVLELFKPMVVASVWKHFTKEMADVCHEHGALIIVDEGKVDPPRDVNCWDQAISLGADGIQTDYPEELIDFLRKRTDSLQENR